MREPFPATRWTLLGRAREENDRGIQARKEFAEIYRRPIVDFLLASVRDPALADDLTQDFFNRLIAKGTLFQNADAPKGSFRALLVTTLRNLVTDYHRKRARVDAKQTHPDQRDDGGWDRMALAAFDSADAAFHRAWVEATLTEALSEVREICAKKGQQIHLALFEARYLGSENPTPSWEDLGEPHGLEQKAARERAETVARHFRIVLRRMLRHQVAIQSGPGGNRAQRNEAAIDREIEALLSPIQD